MKKIMFWITLIVGITVVFGSCSSSEDTTTTSSTSLPDYATTTLSGKIGTDWTFKTGRMVVPSSSSGSYSYDMTNDNLSNACSSSYTGTSSNPSVYFSRDAAPEAGEHELSFTSGNVKTVAFYDGTTIYIIAKGKITIDTVTTTAVTGKMYAISGSDTDHEINGTFTLSRCCIDNSTYSLCSG
jgi:hypothetical protein